RSVRVRLPCRAVPPLRGTAQAPLYPRPPSGVRAVAVARWAGAGVAPAVQAECAAPTLLGSRAVPGPILARRGGGARAGGARRGTRAFADDRQTDNRRQPRGHACATAPRPGADEDHGRLDRRALSLRVLGGELRAADRGHVAWLPVGRRRSGTTYGVPLGIHAPRRRDAGEGASLPPAVQPAHARLLRAHRE